MSEIAALRKLVDDLAVRVAAIEEGVLVENATLRRQGFTSYEATLLALILKRELVSRQAAMTVLYGAADDPPNDKIVDVYLSRVREKLRKRGLPTPITRAYAGWWLDRSAKMILRKRLGLDEVAG